MAKIKNPLTVVASGAPDLMVRFYDYDGTLLSGAKIKSITALPTPPVHDGLTFLRWSRTLDAIKASENDAYVYGVYKPTDGKSRVRLSFTTSTLATTLWFSQTKSAGLEIDWGDGSEAERVTGEGTVSVLHTYAARGSYTITLTPDNDCEWSPGSGTTTANNSFVSNTARAAVTSVELGDGVTTIPQYCFYGFSGMVSILMPEAFEQTNIGTYAFYNCSSLTSITIPDSVTTIGSSLFYNCSSLTSVVIPDSVTTIGNSVFYDCSGLTSITIPESVTSMGQLTFSGCSGLTKIILPDTISRLPADSASMFAGWGNLRSVTLIGGGGNVEIGNRTFIGTSLFNSCDSLQSVTIPDSATSINENAFRGCSNYDTAFFAKAGTYSKNAFLNCSSVTSFTLGGISRPVTSIINTAFSGCTQSCPISIYTMPQYVTTLINNTRNGAINATIIIKAASDTVYEGVAYSAGETMVTSNPTV